MSSLWLTALTRHPGLVRWSASSFLVLWFAAPSNSKGYPDLSDSIQVAQQHDTPRCGTQHETAFAHANRTCGTPNTFPIVRTEIGCVFVFTQVRPGGAIRQDFQPPATARPGGGPHHVFQCVHQARRVLSSGGLLQEAHSVARTLGIASEKGTPSSCSRHRCPKGNPMTRNPGDHLYHS